MGKFFNQIMRRQKDEKMSVAEDEHQERLLRCIPAARKILKIIADNRPFLGDVIDKKTGLAFGDAHESYIKIAGMILVEMFNSNLLFTDKQFVFQLAKQAMSLSEEKVMNSLDRSLERAETMLFGKDIMSLTLSDIDLVLKSKGNESLTNTIHVENK